jgi:predicted O-methyltransferase YrrM
MAVQSRPPATLKQRVATVAPGALVTFIDGFLHNLRRRRIRTAQWFFGLFGYNIVKKADYYSVLPVLSEIEATRERWEKPSALTGVNVNVPVLEKNLAGLAETWEDEFARVSGDYLANTRKGFGPGYPQFDARTLYYMLREHKPKRYLEVGSGLSTYYTSLAAEQNAAEGSPLQITCIEPYPFDALRTIDGFELVEGFVQDVPLERFEELEAGDVLFIDSSHALKIDSDVAFLFMEALPRVKPGVLVHIHDIHFPYNHPYPADYWLFGERWPVYWQEVMLVQAFLQFNDSFEVLLSTPLVRHHHEAFLTETFPDYTPVVDDINPPSSLWLKRTK